MRTPTWLQTVATPGRFRKMPESLTQAFCVCDTSLIMSKYIRLLKNPAVVALVLANSVPFFGVLFFEWTVPEVLVTYWCESVAIGLFTLLEMSIRALYQAVQPKGNKAKVSNESGGTEIFGFVFMYGGGLVIMLFFLAILAHGNETAGTLGEWFSKVSLLVVLGLLVSHAISFVKDFLGKRAYVQAIKVFEASARHERIIFMLGFFFLAGLLTRTFNLPVVFMAVFVLVKILVDIHIYQKG